MQTKVITENPITENYNVQYGNKNYHVTKRKGGDRNRIKANEVKDNEEGKRALVGQTDRTGRR